MSVGLFIRFLWACGWYRSKGFFYMPACRAGLGLKTSLQVETSKTYAWLISVRKRERPASFQKLEGLGYLRRERGDFRQTVPLGIDRFLIWVVERHTNSHTVLHEDALGGRDSSIGKVLICLGKLCLMKFLHIHRIDLGLSRECFRRLSDSHSD